MSHGVILDQDSLGPEDIDLSAIQTSCDSWDIHPHTQAKDTAQRCREAEVIISNKVVIDRAVLSQCPKLKLIAVAATGTNNIDLIAAKAQGVAVCNVAGYGIDTVAQHCWSLILALTTNLLAYQRDSRNGRWSDSRFFCLLDHPIIELQGKTLGIIGYGAIGQAVARIAAAFGMQVLISQRPGSPNHSNTDRIPFAELLKQADIVSLHCPLTAQNTNLIDRHCLQIMKPSALLINCGLGGLIHEADLAEALQAGAIAGAGLDVLSQEPPPKDHILLQQGIPNLILTPHSAWASREARQRLVDIMAANIQSFYRGELLNKVA